MIKKIIGIPICVLMIVIVVSAASGVNVHPAWDMKEMNNSEPCQREPAFSLGLITIKIVGTVTYVSDDDILLGGAIHVGDTINGKYTYNSNTPDSDPYYPNIGEYEYKTYPYGFEVTAGGFVFKTNPRVANFTIWVYNNITYYGNPLDFLQVISFHGLPLSNGMSVYTIWWELLDSTGTALSSADLPTTAPVLTNWDYYEGMDLMINGKDPSNTNKDYTIYAHVTEATKISDVNVNGAEPNWSTPSVTTPYYFNLPFKQFWMTFFERFPHTFPILRHMMGY